MDVAFEKSIILGSIEHNSYHHSYTTKPNTSQVS